MLDADKRTALRLATERARYRDLFEAIGDGCLVTDTLGTIRETNVAAATMLDADARDLRGEALSAFVHDDDASKLRDAIASLDRVPSVDLELRLRPRGSSTPSTPSTRWVKARAARTDGGRRVLFVVHDVTEQRADREDLVRANRALETAVGEHSAALLRSNRDNQELLARERERAAQLASANRAKDRFLAVLSHDLRAPIHAALGWTQLLRREILDRNTRDRALAAIERSTQRQLTLVEELLDVSRIAAGKIQLDVKPIDLAVVVGRALDSVRPAATEKGVNLVYGSTTPAPHGQHSVYADARRIEQVADHLLSNAVKFTPPGGTIEVALTRVGTQICLSVSDNGHGITAEALPHLFERFRRGADDPATRDGLGLGLGLYIVRHLVELHGGTVRAESDGEGHGAAFTVSLPARDVEVPSNDRAVAARAVGTMLDGVRALVLDDEADSRELVATVLTRHGAEVKTAADVPAALAIVDAWAPDVVLSDIGLRGHDGYAFIRELRGRRGGEVPALAVTGFASLADAKRALVAGFDAHVPKPIDAHDLVRVVREAIERP